MKQKLSNGFDSTAGNWVAICQLLFGAESRATDYMRGQVRGQGKDAEILANEHQLLQMLSKMHFSRRGEQ